jgi:pyridoxine 5-phosphate synthase
MIYRIYFWPVAKGYPVNLINPIQEIPTPYMRLHLGVNIDHVATLRQARYREMLDSPNAEPSLLEAALISEQAGADSITVHLRADRRHIQDADVFVLRERLRTKLNLEMGNTAEIIEIALRVKPDFVCLVPENRQEVTTEGGLDVASQTTALQQTVKTLQTVGAKVSMFIDPELEQVRASAEIGADMIELHTGTFANAVADARLREVDRLTAAAVLGHELGLQVNAGHGLTTSNLPDLFRVPHLVELNIGHSIVSHALFIGLAEAVREMRIVMDGYRG